jgi:hypothetical protein
MYNNFYYIKFLINGQDTQTSGKDISFSLHDSIYSFYSNATLRANDITGLLRDNLFAVEGLPLEINFGTDEVNQNIIQKIVTISSDTPETTMPGICGGYINLKGNHAFYSTQNVEGKAYTGTISSIVNEVTDYPFTKKSISSTSGSTTWYRLQQSQKDFIESVLLPNAYSPSANGTPFYCFTDLSNTFNFKSYHEMYNQNSVATLQYKPWEPSNIDFNCIFQIVPFITGSKYTKKLWHRKEISRSISDGSYTAEDVYLYDSPEHKWEDRQIPIIGDKDLTTDYDYLSFKYTESGEKEAYLGRKIFKQRKGFALEKFVITLSFNPALKSGIPIDLDVAVSDDAGYATKALYLSGKYLIEDCIHEWRGGLENRAYTTLVVSRKFVTAPNVADLSKLFLGN